VRIFAAFDADYPRKITPSYFLIIALEEDVVPV
jgi:hypothetical protein